MSKVCCNGTKTITRINEKYLDSNTHARIKLDVSISYEEANFLRETFAEKFNVRELHLLRQRR